MSDFSMYNLTRSQQEYCDRIERQRNDLRTKWQGRCDRDDELRYKRQFEELGEELWAYVRKCQSESGTGNVGYANYSTCEAKERCRTCGGSGRYFETTFRVLQHNRARVDERGRVVSRSEEVSETDFTWRRSSLDEIRKEIREIGNSEWKLFKKFIRSPTQPEEKRCVVCDGKGEVNRSLNRDARNGG